MTGFATNIGFEARALQLHETRASVLLSNIANAATPNYKARDFNFASALSQATNGSSASQFTPPTLGYRVPMIGSLDGNTVEPSVEQAAFAENALGYQSSLTFLNQRLSNLMTAIRGQ